VSGCGGKANFLNQIQPVSDEKNSGLPTVVSGCGGKANFLNQIQPVSDEKNSGLRWQSQLLAEEWLLPELMSALRAENLRGYLPPIRYYVVRQIKVQLTAYLQKGSFNSRRSDTARLFAPPVFRN